VTQDLAAGSRCRAPWRRGSSRSGDEFAAVAAAEGGHHAAQVAAYRHGEQVVDLWTGLEITGDSLLGAYSTSKGAAYLVVALLVQECALDLDEKVSHYWPEFAAGGGRDILLRELLAHRQVLPRPARGPGILSAQPALMTLERLPALAASATAPDSLTGIAFNRNHRDSREVWPLPNRRAVRAAGTLS
jgi:CubicO group peptidase (beta-lactamase class C family)